MDSPRSTPLWAVCINVTAPTREAAERLADRAFRGARTAARLIEKNGSEALDVRTVWLGAGEEPREGSDRGEAATCPCGHPASMHSSVNCSGGWCMCKARGGGEPAGGAWGPPELIRDMGTHVMGGEPGSRWSIPHMCPKNDIPWAVPCLACELAAKSRGEPATKQPKAQFGHHTRTTKYHQPPVGWCTCLDCKDLPYNVPVQQADGDSAAARCFSTHSNVHDDTIRCDLPAGHKGPHSGAGHQWGFTTTNPRL